MKTLITRIKRLALVLCFVTPLVSWAAVDYTGTDYEPWNGVAGAVVWRATTSLFHTSTVANIADDGTIGSTYTMTADSDTTKTWKRFASNQGGIYTSPGMLLVYDEAGKTASSDAQFAPLSFGGLWVKALQAEGVPYSITDNKTDGTARNVELGAANTSTYFKFDKSFTIDRNSATEVKGTATVEIADGATFTINNRASKGAKVDSGNTLVLKGANTGTLKVVAGLTVGGTLDLSAATRPAIDGDVTLSAGSTIVLPAGTEVSAESPFTVCSGTLSSVGVIYVKVGTADAEKAVISTSAGTITAVATTVTYTATIDGDTAFSAIEWTVGGEAATITSMDIAVLEISGTGVVTGLTEAPAKVTLASGVTLDVTELSAEAFAGIEKSTAGTYRWTSGFPITVPQGWTYEYVGGSTEAGTVTISEGMLNDQGNLKTSGYLSIDNFWMGWTTASLDILDGKTTIGANSNEKALRGTVTIREDAELVNTRESDALAYDASAVVNVYGTLSMGATRWSLGSNNTLNFYEGCTVTGSGQSSNGTFDWIENATATLNVDGDVTLAAPIRIRSTATVNVNVDTTEQKGLTLAGTLGVGKIVKKGTGLVKFTTNPPYAITVERGAFTFAVDATPTITYSAKPGAGTSMSMWYAKQATWKGTVVIGALAAPAALPLDTYGNANSKIVLTGTTGNCYLNGTTTVAAELVVGTNANNVVEFNNGNSNQVGTFSKVSGPGTLRLKAWTGCQAATYVLNTLNNFEGLAVANNITRNGGGTFTVRIGNIVTTRTTNPGDCVLPIVNTAVDNTTGTVVYDLANAKVNGTTLDLEAKSDGIYVVVPVTTVDITIPEVDNATVSVTADGVVVTPVNGVVTVDIGAAVVVTYTAAEGYTIANGTIEFNATAETTAVDTTGVTAKAHVAWIYDENSALVGSPYTDELTAVQDFLYYGVGESIRFLAQSTYHDMLLEACTYDEETFTYTRKPAEPTVATITIGGKVYEYPTLAAAIADGQNATIVLVDDIDLTGENENITIPATKSDAAFVTTLDLNGHSIAGDNDGDITVLGTLTLKDTAANSEGRIYSTTDYGTGHTTGLVLVQDSGVFNMESGAIYAVRETPVDNGQYAIITKGNARVNISGGTITAGWYVVGANNLDGVALTVNITGGTLVSTTDYALYVVGNMTVNISGTAAVSGAAGMASVRKGSLTISGGTFATSGDGDVGSWTDGTATLNPTKALINLAADYAVSSVAISGGSFTAGAQADCIVVGAKAKAGSTASVTGGSFSSNPSNFVAFGYKATETAGIWTVAKQPTTPPETPQVIDVDTTKEPEQQQADADAIAQDTVVSTPNADVAAAVSAETYDGYFTKTAVKDEVSGDWMVQTALNEEVVFPTSESAELTADLADVLDVAAGADVEITTAKPGLYYSIEAAENVGFTSGKVEGARELATTTTVSPAKPTVTGTPTAVFFRVKVSATPNNN